MKDPRNPKVRLKQKICAHSGHEMVTSPCFLPEEFFVRVSGTRAGYFDTVELPFFEGYRPFRYLQFNAEKSHFRTVRKLGRKAVVLDGTSSELLDS